MLNFNEIDLIKKNFAKGGYVLDFTNETFSKFCNEVIQLDIQKVYSNKVNQNLSKGKSLIAFFEDNKISENKKLTLLEKLIERAKILNNRTSNFYCTLGEIEEIEKIYQRHKNNKRNNLQCKNSSEFLEEQIKKVKEYIDENNSYDALGKCKEIIETYIKDHLDLHCINYSKDDQVPKLGKQLIEYYEKLNILSENKIVKTKGIITLIHEVCELRNKFGSGHGHASSFEKVNIIYAKISLVYVQAIISFIDFCEES